MAPLPSRTLASYLSRHLAPEAWQISVIDFDANATAPEMLAQLASCEPDVIGLSCYLWNARSMFALCRELHKNLPGPSVVLGGPQLNYDAEDMEQLQREVPGVALTVVGEGEIALQRFLELPEAERPPPGTVWRGEVLSDLDLLGSPIHGPYPPSSPSHRIVCLEVSRGCVYRCGFCTLGLPDGGVRRRSIEALSQDLAWVAEHNIKLVMYSQYAMNERGTHALARVEAIEASGTAKSVYHFFPLDYFRVTDEEIAALARINALVDIGVQSATSPALRTVRRGFDLDRLERVVNACTKHGLPIVLELMAGLPGETLDSFRKTLSLIASLGVPLDAYALHVLPGTDLYLRRHELQLRYDPRTHALQSSATMSEDELKQALLEASEVARKNPSPTYAVWTEINQSSF